MSEVPNEETQEQDGPEPDEQPTPIQPPDQDEEDEAHESEEVEGQEGGPEPAPEASGPVGAVGEKELERMFKKVDAANLAYLKRLEGVLGDELQVLEPCPRCVAPFIGLIWPPSMRPVDEPTKALVLASVGEEVEPELEQDPYSRRCDVCKGRGYTKTGAVLNSQRRIACLPCGARGWVAVGDERRVARQAVTTPVEGNGSESPTEQPPDEDPWHRKPDDPNYGRLPQYVGQP